MAVKRRFKAALAKKKSARSKNVLKRFRQAPAPAVKRTVNAGKGFPKKMVMTHEYEENINITSTGGAMTVTRFALNGMYDPNISGTGHQPLNFDQMTALYNHYTVIGAKATVSVINQTSGGTAGVFGITVNDDISVAFTDISGLGEQGAGKTRLLAAAMNQPETMTQTWSAKQTFGGDIMANNSLSGTVSANPSELSYLDVVYQALGGATTAVSVKVHIEFIAMWTELKDQAQS